jgi:hypothetical protein
MKYLRVWFSETFCGSDEQVTQCLRHIQAAYRHEQIRKLFTSRRQAEGGCADVL